ncbi:MAG: PEP-CTERM sorting domain-containing protein [Verrucomicrobiota bacterium]
MKKLTLPTLALLAITPCVQAHADVLADWTFETSDPSTAGPLSPEVGSGSALGFHSGSSTYSAPAGNGSSHSFSSTDWLTGDYLQFQVDASNYQDLSISWDQTSSNTGPRDFTLEYSTNGTDFTAFGTYEVLANATPNSPWSTQGTRNAAYTVTDDLSSIDDLDGASTVFFRLVDDDATAANGGAVGTGGTDRVDNVVISGTALAAPEPSSWALGVLAFGALAFAGLRRSRTTIG